MRASLACAALAAVLGMAAGAAKGADSAGPAAVQPSVPGIELSREGGPPRLVTAKELAAMPAVQVTVRSEPGHGPPERTFAGPLLWTVLERGGLLEGLGPRDQAHEFVIVTGRDAYVAVLALGELSPELEAKQVIIAGSVDGQPIPAENLRVVVPGDKRGARNVHEISRIDIASPTTGTR